MCNYGGGRNEFRMIRRGRLPTKIGVLICQATHHSIASVVSLMFLACLGLAQAENSGLVFQPNATASERAWANGLEGKAESGSAEAQYEFSKAYMGGRVLKQDVGKAVRWVQAAAKQGLPEAEVNLGLLYHSGTGVSFDYSKALYWMRKAANQGNVKAQYNMGVMFAYGQGVNQDFSEAVRWYIKAAEQGHQVAAYDVGMAYWLGVGVARDEVKGYMWQYLAASRFGYPPSRHVLKTLDAKLDKAKIVEGRKEADEWVRAHPNVKPVAL
jgi:TPR repeat protein